MMNGDFNIGDVMRCASDSIYRSVSMQFTTDTAT